MVTSAALTALDRDLRNIFSDRLRSLVAYSGAGPATTSPASTLAIVEHITAADLRACADRVTDWHEGGLSTPLLLEAHEFARSLDAFPFEFGAILADHVVVSGSNPFDGLRVETHDLRRACEVQARSHLLHLREGFLETRGRADALADLIVASAPAFAGLITSIARLEGHGGDDRPAAARHVERIVDLPGAITEVTKLVGVQEISSPEAERLFPPYFMAVERLVSYVDGWSAR